MISLFPTPRTVFLLILGVCLALVAGGVAMSYFMGLAACPLCIIQRMIYLAIAFAVILALPIFRFRVGRVLGSLMVFLLAGLGMFVAGYQTWIQRFSPDTGCSGRMTWWEEFVDWAGSEVPLLFESSGLCSDPGWVFLGLSIAEWSLLFFIGLLFLALHTLFRRR